VQLYIGNKNYSSWSMRPWVMMRHWDIPFEEVMLRFDSFEGDSKFKRTITAVSPTGKVPLLLDDGYPVWDSLAIAEYLAEKFPALPLWPRDARTRARARCIAAEIHSGFSALREHCPQNLEVRMPEIGKRVLAEQAAVRADLQRVDALWQDALAASGGPYLFGEFGIADAMYTPVAGRVLSYDLPLSAAARAYVDRLYATPAVQAWVGEALEERDFVVFDEPYRKHR
jgi:glutathione S-transferase